MRTYGGLEFTDEETLGTAHPDGDGLFMHPPYKGVPRVTGGGQNVTFLDYPIRLPDFAKVRFTTGVQLKAGAEGHSDGVTFRAVATCGGEERRCQVHYARESTRVLEMDLSAWRSKSIVLHLEADPGLAGAPDYDWGRFVRPQISVQDDTPPAPQTLGLAGFARPQRLRAAESGVEMTLPPAKPGEKTEIQVKCRLPNTLIYQSHRQPKPSFRQICCKPGFPATCCSATAWSRPATATSAGVWARPSAAARIGPRCPCILRRRASRWWIGG